MSNFFDFTISLLFLCTAIVVFVIGIDILNKHNCTSSQLHEVIAAVEKCNKQNLICSSDDKDKILREVCR